MIEPTYSKLAQTVYTINNANRPWGTLIEEIPTDVGRSYAGYKRGGVLEGAEKMRKELMTAAVWMAGIPLFNKFGNYVCEKILNIPTAIEYSNSKEGNAAIEDSVNYLVKGANPKNLDVSELQKYKDKFKNVDAQQLIKKVKCAKQVTSILAVILNCAVIGFALPKINQAITNKKLKENAPKDLPLKVQSMDEFLKDTKEKSSSNPVFKGGFAETIKTIPDKATYLTENSNTFRLVITDIPMILGRMITSRNKYEALEYLVMDGGSIFFYNFCANMVQKKLRNISKVPDINPKAAEIIAQAPQDEIKNAFEMVKSGKNSVSDIFSKDTARLIYQESTYGKYGKINRFVKDKDIKYIDEAVVKTLDYFKNTATKMNVTLFNEKGEINTEALTKVAKKTASDINKANAGYLAVGLGLSILGLAVIIPKLTFAITKKLTGKDQFTGIANYDDQQNVKKS